MKAFFLSLTLLRSVGGAVSSRLLLLIFPSPKRRITPEATTLQLLQMPSQSGAQAVTLQVIGEGSGGHNDTTSNGLVLLMLGRSF